MKREHAEKLEISGMLRLGTIWDFRKASYGDQIGGSEEGMRFSPIVQEDGEKIFHIQRRWNAGKRGHDLFPRLG